MTITNKWLDKLLTVILRRHVTTYSFMYERSYRDEDVIPAQFRANYIRELREKTEEFTKELESQGGTER